MKPELSGKLMAQGFQVIPHIAAKSVSGETHLETIVKRLDALSIENIFVPGGDLPEPMGEFKKIIGIIKLTHWFR
jgi:methylenetetrahydrofolate reductase (NADPH)